MLHVILSKEHMTTRRSSMCTVYIYVCVTSKALPERKGIKGVDGVGDAHLLISAPEHHEVAPTAELLLLHVARLSTMTIMSHAPGHHYHHHTPCT